MPDLHFRTVGRGAPGESSWTSDGALPIRELPVSQSVKFDFVLNLGTARTFGLTVPPTLFAVADDLIE
jgi:hypothetical protein